jgi:hypothetical protein
MASKTPHRPIYSSPSPPCTKIKKSILKSTSSDGDLFFRGGSNVLKPNHITRYEYPCPLHLPRSSLCLQTPTNASRRSRPQGQGRANFSTDGTMSLTITRAYRDLPCASNLAEFSAHEKTQDKKHTNPLGCTMAHATKYPGNTLLQSEKFAMKNGLMYIVKRTTFILLKDGGFAREEEVYEILCRDRRKMQPLSQAGFDSWW